MTQSFVFWSVLAYVVYCFATGYSSQWYEVFTKTIQKGTGTSTGQQTKSATSSSGTGFKGLVSL